MIINRHEDCIGITLYSFGKYRAEIWICPPCYRIEEHSHPSEDVELMHLYGKTIFYRRNLWTGVLDSVTPKMFQRFSVRHSDSHWFSVGDRRLIFINFQTFLNGEKPRSAAIDFEITKL